MTYSDKTRAWAESFSKCWVCGALVGQWGGQIHHFVRGVSRRENDRRTTAIVCAHCHNDEHRKEGGIGLVGWLALKMVHDPELYDREAVNIMRHRAKDAISEAEVAAEVSKLFQKVRRR